MKVNLAHLREQAQGGGWIDFAVFDAKSTAGTDSANAELLAQLTAAARKSGLKVDQSALAYKQGNQIKFYGDKNLVDYLSAGWVPQWTHTINV